MDSRSMKRGRGNPRMVETAVTTTKKAKGAAEKVKEEAAEKVVVVVEERSTADSMAAEVEEWGGGWWSGVDEEMSWASCWFPFWERGAVGDAYDSSYGDVLWDYDIWGLKATDDNNATNP